MYPRWEMVEIFCLYICFYLSFQHRRICAEVDSGKISEDILEKIRIIVDSDQNEALDTCIKPEIKSEPMDYWGVETKSVRIKCYHLKKTDM